MKKHDKGNIMKMVFIPRSMYIDVRKERLNFSKFVRQAYVAYKDGKWEYDNMKD